MKLLLYYYDYTDVIDDTIQNLSVKNYLHTKIQSLLDTSEKTVVFELPLFDKESNK